MLLVGLAVLVAACATPPPGPTQPPPPPAAPASPPSATARPSPVATGAVPTPSAAPRAMTPERVVDAFLALARDPDASFAVSVDGRFEIGSQRIAYALEGRRAGPDVIMEGTERIDGREVPYGTAFIGGRLIGLGDAGWTTTAATPEQAELFGAALVSLRNALVLEDLGPDPSGDGYRLLASAGLSLFPPQMSSTAIPDGHDAASRLELVVDADGRPVRALYTVSLAGTINGEPGTASGTVTFDFRDVGSLDAIELPAPAPGSTFGPATSAATAPPEAAWTSVDLVRAPFRVAMPGTPTVSNTKVPNPALGDIEQMLAQLAGPGGATYAAIELGLPAAYIEEQGALAVAREAVGVEARQNGATVVGMRLLSEAGPPGVEAVLAREDGMLLRVRVYVLEGDVLELVVAGGPGMVATADADRFLASLETVP